MSFEVTYEDEIPQGDGPYVRGLWAEAHWWVDNLLIAFGNLKEIARIGLTRRLGLRCRNWLWSIEGMVRRLIIATALTFDASTLPALVTAKRNEPTSQPQTPPPAPETPQVRKPSCAFRIFVLHRKLGPRVAPRVYTLETLHLVKVRKKHAPRAPLPLHRHLAFPVDDLLAIDTADIRAPLKPGRSVRRSNPLDRRGRLSRWDPAYVFDAEKEQAASDRYMFGPFPDRSTMTMPPAPARSRGHRDIHDPYRLAGASDWRRVEQEWARIIPAPDLAGRIAALVRVMDKPERWVERLARLFQARPKLAGKLTAIPEPVLKKPKRDSAPEPPGLDFLKRCHAAIPRGDTS